MSGASATGSRRAWLVWTIGLVAYIVAVLQRSSFGVAGHQAADRFEVSAAELSIFVVVQLLAYAGGQIPVGVLLDRYGPRALLMAGALVLGLGQVAVACSTSFGFAILGRLVVGLGDAATYISVIRVLPWWFAPRQVPLLTQLTGIIGQLGQILSAVPLLYVLVEWGWAAAFLGAAATCVLSLVLVAAAFADAPVPVVHERFHGGADVLRRIADTWRQPGTRLGLWLHSVTLGTVNLFTLLWGVPFVLSLGYDQAHASLLLTLLTLVSAVSAPVVGRLTAIAPRRRPTMGLVIAACIVASWIVVLAWPGQPPFWVLIVFTVVLSTGGPGSSIAFDITRTELPERLQGLASGFVNVGGFTTNLLAMLIVGVSLDVISQLTGRPPYDGASFRIAMALQLPLALIAAIGVLRSWRSVLRQREASAAQTPAA